MDRQTDGHTDNLVTNHKYLCFVKNVCSICAHLSDGPKTVKDSKSGLVVRYVNWKII